MKLADIITNNFWPKMIAMVLAVLTWFYVFDLINIDPHKKETVEEVLEREDFIIKDLPVKLVFSGKTPAGFKVIFDQVKIDPQTISVLGPKSIMDKVEEVKTDRINLGEYTRSTELRLGLNSDFGHLKLDDKAVDVFLPIEKLDKDRSKEYKR